MDNLRQKAEELLNSRINELKNMPADDVQKILEELHVHQMELQIQNQELRESRLELENARAKYFNLFEKAPIGYIVLDTKGIITELNLKASEILGKSKSYLLNKPIVNYLESKQISKFYNCFDEIKENSSLSPFDLILSKNCNAECIELTVSPFFIGQYLTAIVDVTEKRKSEATIKSQFRDLSERIKEKNCIYNITGLLGRSDQLHFLLRESIEFIAQGWQYPEITAARIVYNNQVYESDNYRQTSWRLEEDIIVYGKTVGLVEVCYLDEKSLEHTGPFLKEEVELLKIISHTIGNIIEKKLALQQLSESEEKYRMFVESSGDAFVLTDESGLVIEWNKAQENMSGITKESAIGKEIWRLQLLMTPEDYITDEYKSQVETGISDYFSTGRAQFLDTNFEVPMKRVDGEIRTVQQHVFGIKTKCGFRLGSVTRDITDAKESQKLLNNAHEQYKTLFEFMPVGLSLSDANGNIILSNKEAERLLGLSKEEIEQRTISGEEWKIIRKDGSNMPPEEFASVRAMNEKRRIENVEMGIVKGSNEVVWINVSASPNIQNNQIIISYIDITEKVLREKKLQEYSLQLKKLNQAVEQSPVTVVITDKNSKIEYVNAAFTKISGYMKSEAIGQPTTILKSDLTREEVFSDLWKTISKGHTWTGEFVNKAKNGRLFDEEAIISPVFNESGEVTNYIAIKTDITLRKQQEEIIKQTNNRLEKLLKLAQTTETNTQKILNDALEIAIEITKSKIGYIYHYNEDTMKFTLNSWSKDVMDECKVRDPETIYDLSKTGIWGEVVRQRRFIIINDFEEENELKKGYPDGHVTITKFLSVPVFYDNKIVAVIGVGNKETDYTQIDVTQLTLLANTVWTICMRIQDEEEIRAYSQELKELNATKDKFFSIIAHDLKNPFQAILGYSELLSRNASKYTTEKIQNQAQNIYQSASNTYKLLTNLLDWARLQNGKMVVNKERVVLHELIQEIIPVINDIATDKGITITIEIDEAKEFFADRSMVKTVIRNLLSNAVKYSYNNSSITVAAIRENENLVISVSDKGVGIESDKIGSLFNIETNISNPGTNNELGTGLGLILCKEFVEKNGGKIWIESVYGEGSTFSFTVPVA